MEILKLATVFQNIKYRNFQEWSAMKLKLLWASHNPVWLQAWKDVTERENSEKVYESHVGITVNAVEGELWTG